MSAALKLAEKWTALARNMQAAGETTEAIQCAVVAAKYVQLAKIMEENERLLGMKDATP